MKIIILFFVLAGMMYSQGLTGHYSSIIKKRPSGASLPTENLIWLVDDDSLSSGAVTVWNDVLDSNDLAQATAGNRPSKTDSGVVFDGSDWLKAGDVFGEPAQTLDVTASFSMVVVATIPDTTAAGMLLTIRDTDGHNMTVGHRSNRLTAYYHDGSTAFNMDVYSTPVYDASTCIIVTRSAANGLRIYINGTLQSEVGTSYLGMGTNAPIINMGSTDNGVDRIVPNDTRIGLGAFYSEELDQDKIDDIMAADEITGKID